MCPEGIHTLGERGGIRGRKVKDKPEWEIDFEKGIKYCPGIEPNLPSYVYREYKPRYSGKPCHMIRVANSNYMEGGLLEREDPVGEKRTDPFGASKALCLDPLMCWEGGQGDLATITIQKHPVLSKIR